MFENYSSNVFDGINNENIEYDFPVLEVNCDHFQNLNEVLMPYGIILGGLSEFNYDIDKYLENMSNDPHLHIVITEVSNLKINKTENNKTLTKLEQVINEDSGKQALEVIYPDTRHTFEITIKNSDSEDEKLNYGCNTVIKLGSFNMYFTSSNELLIVRGEDIKLVYLDQLSRHRDKNEINKGQVNERLDWENL